MRHAQRKAIGNDCLVFFKSIESGGFLTPLLNDAGVQAAECRDGQMKYHVQDGYFVPDVTFAV